MIDNKFTVVIPTRERADTLYWSLKTCADQGYENLEIIVSDNDSQDNTKDVVKSFNDSRIKYINTGKRVGMSQNWEFALSHVLSGYVLFIGDDDGILPNAVAEINSLLNEYKSPSVFTWKYPYYTWKSARAVTSQNNFIFSLSKGISIKNAEKELIKLSRFETNYTVLPCIYNGSFVNVDVINKIKKISGNFFRSLTPDVYSTIAILSVIDRFVFSETAYSISGLSKHSTGVSQLVANKDDNEKQSPVEKFLMENEIAFHPKIDYCPSLYFIIAESFLQAIDSGLLPPNFEIPMKDIIRNTIEVARNSSLSLYNQAVDGARKNAVRYNLTDWTEDLILKNPFNNNNVIKDGINKIDNTFSLNPDHIGVENIYEATLMMKTINLLKEEDLLKGDQWSNSMYSALKLLARRTLPKDLYFPIRNKIVDLFR